MTTSSTHPDPANAEDYELLLPAGQSDTSPSDTQMGREEQLLKSEHRNGDKVAIYAALGASSVTLVSTWIAIFSNFDLAQQRWFVLHPPLQVLSVTIFTYGILTLQPTSQPKTKAAGLSRHQVAMFLLGLPLIIVGTWAIWYNKESRGADHFKTWHGTLGAFCMVWLVGQVALGGASVWFEGAAFGGGMKAKAIWKYHRLSGYVLFPLFLLTINLGGGWSGWGERNTAYPVRLIAYSLCPAIVLAGVYRRVRVSKMKFF